MGAVLCACNGLLLTYLNRWVGMWEVGGFCIGREQVGASERTDFKTSVPLARLVKAVGRARNAKDSDKAFLREYKHITSYQVFLFHVGFSNDV